MIRRKCLFSTLVVACLTAAPAKAQRILSLDSCRQMALRNNKQMGVARVKQELARNVRKSARTKYLPHVNAFGGYMYVNKEFSLLNDDQKSELGNLGSSSMGAIGQIVPDIAQMLSQEQIGALTNMFNATGQGLVDALHTDTRNLFAATLQVTQPIFMGGSIIAMNKMADIAEDIACNTADAQRQMTI